MIGVFNIIGTITAGALGNVYRKKYLLAGIYAGRTLIAAWFILVPMTPFTVLVFSVVMGSLWLATVPLTSGLVAYMFGLRYMGTLIVFSLTSWAPLGSGGGILHDRFGSYQWCGGSVWVQGCFPLLFIFRSMKGRALVRLRQLPEMVYAKVGQLLTTKAIQMLCLNPKPACLIMMLSVLVQVAVINTSLAAAPEPEQVCNWL